MLLGHANKKLDHFTLVSSELATNDSVFSYKFKFTDVPADADSQVAIIHQSEHVTD